MNLVAKDVEVRQVHPIPVKLALGRCVLGVTTNPWAMMPPDFCCYAILASWLADGPVGMFVSFRSRPATPDADDYREVHTVYATPAFRGPRTNGEDTVPVLIGRWLFEERLLTRHSPDRNEAGDRWARAVGGELPKRDQRGTPEATTKSSEAALARLNELAWPGEVLADWAAEG